MLQEQQEIKQRPANRRLAKKRVQWLNEHSTSYQILCWVDSLVLRKPLLRQAPKRYARRCLPFSPILHMGHFYSGWQLTTATQHGYSGWLKDGYSERLVKKMATQHGYSTRLVGWQLNNGYSQRLICMATHNG